MGLLHVNVGQIQYLHELGEHSSKRRTELPVEELNAVFIETGGAHPSNAEHLTNLLNQKEKLWRKKLIREFETQTTGILQRAKKAGTEIWLGDVKPTKKEIASWIAVYAAGIAARGLIGGVVGGPAVAAACAACSPHLFFCRLAIKKRNS